MDPNLQRVSQDEEALSANSESALSGTPDDSESLRESHGRLAGQEKATSENAEQITTDSRDGSAEFWSARGHYVKTLVRRTENYIVHICANTNRIDWETLGQQESEDSYDPARESRVIALAAVLEARPCADLPEAFQKEFRILIGEAMVSAFDRAYDTADMLLDEAKLYITARSLELSRYWLVFASLGAACPLIIVGVLLWLFRSSIMPFLGADFFWLLIAGCLGGLGALFSVLIRSGSASSDCASGRRLHNLEGSTRILTGAIAGVFVVMAFRSGVIIPELLKNAGSNYFTLVLAIAAGSGERLAGSIMEKFQITK